MSLQSTIDEATLTRWGIGFQYLPIVPLDQIDRAASLRNQARVVPLDEATVSRYVQALLDGAVLPPVWIINTNSRLVLVDGNNRVAALDRVGEKATDAYLILNEDGYILDLLRRSANTRHGWVPGEEETLDSAVYLCETYARPAAEIAKRFSLSAGTLAGALRRRQIDRALVKLGFDPRKIASTSRLKLGTVKNENVVAALAPLASRASVAEFDKFTQRVLSGRTEAAQLAEVAAIMAGVGKELIADPSSSLAPGARPRGPERERFFAAASRLDGLLGHRPTLASNQITIPDDCRRAETLLRQLARRIALVLGNKDENGIPNQADGSSG